MAEIVRKLASVQRVLNIEPIENADAIEKLTVQGWSLVARKGEFKVNDLCIYFQVDSILPITPWSEFLVRKDASDPNKPIRLKTVKLRGQISSGLALPISILGSYRVENDKVLLNHIFDSNDKCLELKEDDDLTELLNIQKYEPPEDNSGGTNAPQKGNFPHFIPKTDAERIQSYYSGIQKKYQDNLSDVKLYLSQKADGSSFSAYMYEGTFGFCSRNFDLKIDEGDSFFHRIVKEAKLEAKMKMLSEKFCSNIAIQGELCGPGIQKNRSKLDKLTLFIFNIYDINKGEYFNLQDFCYAMEFMKEENIQMVPLRGVKDLTLTIDEWIELSKQNIDEEGIVAVTVDNKKDSHNNRLMFKVINPEYLLKHNL